MRVLLVGDTHGNSLWWEQFVAPAAENLRVDAVCQLGDFGFWPRGEDFIKSVYRTPAPVFFIDGNHEHHEYLNAESSRGERHNEAVLLGGNLYYLPRGAHVQWGGVEVVALGGARSIDRAWRTPGHDWFFQEAINEEDLGRVISKGSAQIMLCHDAPLCADVPLIPEEEMSSVWRSEIRACQEHRLIIEKALDEVKPELFIHGHYHVRWSGRIHREWGECAVEGLSEDRSGIGNLAVLECDQGEFSFKNLEQPRV